MNFLSESVIAVMRMGKTKDSKQLSSHLVQCSLFCELGCCSFYFILSNHYCLRAQVFCRKSCSVSCLILPFSHIHISVPATGQQLLKYAFGIFIIHEELSRALTLLCMLWFNVFVLCGHLWSMHLKDITGPAQTASSLPNVQCLNLAWWIFKNGR